MLVAAACLAAPASAAAGSTTIVINEVQFRGLDGNDEFVELRNISSEPVNIGGWVLQGCSAGPGTPSARTTVPADTIVPAGGAYLFVNGAGTLAFAADRTYGTGLSDDGGVRIVNGATVIDGVANQDASADQCREGTGAELPDAERAHQRVRAHAGHRRQRRGLRRAAAARSAEQPGDVEDPRSGRDRRSTRCRAAGAASPLAGQP